MWPQFTSMLSPMGWTIVALVPPAIVALYFLKLRRRPVEVPSTYLWRRSLEDLHVNSLWQRLRQSLLLLLQLIVVGLVILALLRPAYRSSKLTGDRFILLVDNSASMSATDVAPTRLAEAKRQARALVEELPSSAVAMIISFADRAKVEQTFTDNHRDLLAAIDRIAPTHRGTSLAEALRVAAGLANPGRTSTDARDIQVADALPATLYIYSDGKFPNVSGFSLGNLQPVFVPIGTLQPDNVACVAIGGRRPDPLTERLQVFARLHNFGAGDVTTDVGLYDGDELIDAQQVTVAAGDDAGVTFSLDPFAAGALQVRVDRADALADDNRAWLAVNSPRRAKVLCVTPGDEPLLVALSTEGLQQLAEVTFEPITYLATPEYLQRSQNGEWALIIYDRCAPAAMPQADTLWLGSVPPGDAWKGTPATTPRVIDVDAGHPLFELVELGDVDIVEGLSLTAPAGAYPLVQSQHGLLAAVAPREGFQDVVIGFPLYQGERVNTNWPLRVSFPLFLFNAVEYLAVGSQTAIAPSVRPGQVVPWPGTGNPAAIEVRLPDGQRQRLPRSSLGEYNLAETEQLGIYSAQEDSKGVERLAVNLLDAEESDLGQRDQNSIEIGYVEVKGHAGSQATPWELWRPLVLTALAVLFFEWYIYNRRVYL